MNKDIFWEMIGRSRKAAGEDDDLFLTQIVAAVKQLPAPDVLHFIAIFLEYLSISYMPGLWEAAIFINNLSCSDDSFHYFRGWLLSQGKQYFLSALQNPDSLADIELLHPCELEQLLYSLQDVYAELSDSDVYDDLEPLPNAEKRMIHSEIQYAKGLERLKEAQEIPAFFPRLYAKYFTGADEDTLNSYFHWNPSINEQVWGNSYLLTE